MPIFAYYLLLRGSQYFKGFRTVTFIARHAHPLLFIQLQTAASGTTPTLGKKFLEFLLQFLRGFDLTGIPGNHKHWMIAINNLHKTFQAAFQLQFRQLGVLKGKFYQGPNLAIRGIIFILNQFGAPGNNQQGI